MNSFLTLFSAQLQGLPKGIEGKTLGVFGVGPDRYFGRPILSGQYDGQCHYRILGKISFLSPGIYILFFTHNYARRGYPMSSGNSCLSGLWARGHQLNDGESSRNESNEVKVNLFSIRVNIHLVHQCSKCVVTSRT